MKFLFPFLILFLSCAVENPGLSYRTAIVIDQVDPNKGAFDEFDYINENYKGYQVVGRQIKKSGSHYYDIFYLRDNYTQWVIYFDITKFHDNILQE